MRQRQAFVDFSQQLHGMHGLVQHGNTPGLEFAIVFHQVLKAVRLTRDQDRLDHRRHFLQTLAQFKTAHHRHHDVYDSKIDRFCAQNVQGLFAVAGFNNLIAPMAQKFGIRLTHQNIIVNDEYAPQHGSTPKYAHGPPLF